MTHGRVAPRLLLGLALLGTPLAALADPITFVALVAPYIGGTTAAFIASNALTLIAVGATVYGTVDARRKQRAAQARSRAAYNASLQDRTITALQADPPWRVIYGRCIIGGDVLAIFTSDKVGTRTDGSTYTKPDGYKHMVVAIAAHQCQAIHEVYIDGVACGPLDGGGWVTTGELAAAYTVSREITIATGGSSTQPSAVTVLQAWDETLSVTSGEYINMVPGTYTLTGGNTVINNTTGHPLRVVFTMLASTGAVRIQKHLGTASQTVDSVLNGLLPAEWTSSDRLRGITYCVITLDLEEPRFQGGPPGIVFDVSGKLVYDPRTGTTAWSANPALCTRDFLVSEWGYGCVSGDIDDSYTIAAANACEARQLAAAQAHAATFTANASTDLLTFASERWFGTGDGVRFTSSGTLPAPLAAGTTYYAIRGTSKTAFGFATTRANAIAGTAINITSAGTGTHTGTWHDYDAYTCNGAFTTAQGKDPVLQDLAECMAGYVTYGAQWLIQAGAWTVPVADLTDADLHGQIELTQGGAGLDEIFNTARGSYVPAGGWAVADFDVYANPTFVAADGGNLYTDLALPFTDNKVRARNLARVFVERNRDSLVIRYPAKLKAWPLQVGDRVRVTSAEYGFSLKTFRVTDWDFNLLGAVVLTLQEDAAAIYDLADAASTDPAGNSALPNPWVVAPITGLAATSGLSEQLRMPDGAIVTRVRVTWNAVADAYVADGSGRIEVIWRRQLADANNAWTTVSTRGDETKAYLRGMVAGDTITIGARAVNGLGARGAYTYITHAVVGNTGLPSSVTGLAGTAANGSIRWTWDRSPDADYARTEVRLGGASWAAAAVPPVFTGSANGFTMAVASVGVYTVWAKHFNRTGNESAVAVSNSVTVTAGDMPGVDPPDLTPPPTPSGLAVTAGLSHIYVSCSTPSYTQGHGHDVTVVYGVISPTGTATFGSAVELFRFQGNFAAYPSATGSRWCIWIKWQSVDGIKSTSPAGGTNGVQATTGVIGTTDLGPLIVEAGNLANSAVTGAKIANGVIDATKFISTVQPIALGPTVPGSLATRTFFNTADGRLYSWNGSAYVKTVPTVDLVGTITTTQIADDSISTPKLQSNSVTANEIAGGTITANEIASDAITAGKILAGSVTATKLAVNAIAVGTAAVQNGAIVNAMIANATIDDAKIANLGVDKLTAGYMQVGAYIRSTGWVSGTSGWSILASGAAEFNSVTVRGGIYATFGAIGNLTINNALTVDSSGHIKGGQTAYNTGTGFFLGYSGGYKFSIGNPGGYYMLWTGTDLIVNAKSLGLPAFYAVIGGGNITVAVANGTRAYGARTVSTAGGTAPFTYQWSLLNPIYDGAGYAFIASGATSTTASFSGYNNNAINTATVQCMVTDSIGRVTTQYFNLSATHGTPA